jgi:hypothetical protein
MTQDLMFLTRRIVITESYMDVRQAAPQSKRTRGRKLQATGTEDEFRVGDICCFVGLRSHRIPQENMQYCADNVLAL